MSRERDGGGTEVTVFGTKLTETREGPALRVFARAVPVCMSTQLDSLRASR